MARSRLADPAYLRLVAECFHAGMSRQDMCDELGVKDKDTITRWRRDPRVAAMVAKLNRDRAIQVSSKVDSVIAGRLSQAKDLTVDELIKIRKEYGGPAAQRDDANDDSLTAEAMKALEENPNLVEELTDLLSKSDAEKQKE